jgi:nucleoside-diphosphate-sugar epimerase
MKARVLITGASGFIGHHLIEEALKNDLDVFAAVRKTSDLSHLQDFKIQYTFPDFNDVPSLKKEIAANNYSYIIHAAGLTKARSENEYNQVNAHYTTNLARAAAESGGILKKFVLISSLAAQGPLNDFSGALTEDGTPKPVTSYGKSKLLGEEGLKALPALNYTILRPTAVYGPRDKDIIIFFRQLVKGIEPYIGDTGQQLSFLYVTDLAKAAVKSLYAGNCETFNLSDGNFYNRYELGRLAKEILSLKTVKVTLPVNVVKLIAILSEAYGLLTNKAVTLNVEKIKELMAVNWNCDIAKAEAVLGFRPEHDLKIGLNETLKWYKLNKWL